MMNPRQRNNYPHAVLHAITGLLAIAALALAAYNFRETRKIKAAAAHGQAGAVLNETAEFVSSEKKVKKMDGDEARSGKTSRPKKKKAPRTAAVKTPARNDRVPPAQSRGLDEIIPDLVNSVLE